MSELSKPQVITVKLIGALLLALPFFPIALFFGKIDGIDYPVNPKQWFLGILCVALITVLVEWLSPNKVREVSRNIFSSFCASVSKTSALNLFFIGSGLVYLCSKFAYHHRPHLIDSIVQNFQGKIFAAGLLKAPLPPEADFFMTQHMIFSETGWYGQYPALQSVFLAIGELLGFPWLTQGICALGIFYFIYQFSLNVFGKNTAITSLLLLCFSPFFIFMSASFMNHVPTLFFVSMFLFFFERWDTQGLAKYSFFAGFSLAGAFLIRPLTAVAIGVLFAVFALFATIKKKSIHTVFSGILGFLSLAWIFPAYNYLTNGSLLLTGYIKLWGSGHGLGFHESPWGDPHTPLFGLRNELIDVTLINEYLFESPIPALLPLSLYLLFSKNLSIWHFRLSLMILCLPAAYFFYWHRDAFLGPRFLFTSLAAVIPLTAHVLASLGKELNGITIGSDSFFRKVSLETFSITSLVLCFLFMICIGIPQRFTVDATSLLTMKRSVLWEAQRQGLDNAVVLVKVSWGNRLLARLRGLGIPASLAQKSYNSIDHCILEETISNITDPKILIPKLEHLVAQKMPLYTKIKNSLNRDPSLALSPNRKLSPVCISEIQYDQTQYSVYLNGLLDNSPYLNGKIVIARDLYKENYRLAQHYPERKFYIYDGSNFREITTEEMLSNYKLKPTTIETQ